MSECTHDCSTCSSDCASREKTSLLEPVNKFSTVGKVIAVVSGKGGVGKSLVTGLLSVLSQRKAADGAYQDQQQEQAERPPSWTQTSPAPPSPTCLASRARRTPARLASFPP